jgi:2-hydroxy-3-oxopropionate reductase
MAVRTGLIGVGAMGSALLSRLTAAGCEVQAYDISAERMAYAREHGALPAASIAEAARDADFIHVFVRTDDELIEVTTAEDGVASHARAGSIILLHSSVMPATSRHIAAHATKFNVRVVDAPVTSIPRMVADGKAVFLLGGATADVADAVPHLDRLGREAIHFGPVGCGNVAKIGKNLINAAERIALAEVCSIVEAGGLDIRQFLQMAAATDGGSTISRWERAFSIESNHATPTPVTNLLNKDIGLAADLASALSVDAPMTQAAAETAKVWVAGWEAGK